MNLVANDALHLLPETLECAKLGQRKFVKPPFTTFQLTFKIWLNSSLD